MHYRYQDGSGDGTIDVAAQWTYSGITHPKGVLTRKPDEDETDWIARINTLGVQPVRYLASPHTPPQQAQGAAVGAEVGGWWEISFPVPINLIHCWDKSTKAEAWLADPIPGTHTDHQPLDAICEWDEARNEWAYCIPENTEQDRRTRDRMLDECQWMVNRHRDQVDAGLTTSITVEQYGELLTFRQALRDMPGAMTDSRDWTWPAVPEFVVFKPLV